MHPADLAEVLDELSFEEAIYIIRLLDSETTSGIIEELDDDTRVKVLEALTPEEIADEIDELDTDIAADIILELPDDRKDSVIAAIDDKEHAQDIVDLLRYDEDTAGGLMGKELVSVNEKWSIKRSVIEMRRQAQELDEVYIVYVVDDDEKLLGRLSLKSLLTVDTKSKVKDIYIDKIHYVKVGDEADEVAQVMQKYDLVVIPVVDELGRLVGNINIDDVLDYIKEVADSNYQLASGLTDDVEVDDTVMELVKGRLPWLVLGLLGGIMSVYILKSFDEAVSQFAELFFFAPLIAGMAGNAGVQSSAIIVQGLANNIVKGSLWKLFFKELKLSLINGLVVALLVFTFSMIFNFGLLFSITIGFSLIVVILLASLIGTFIPIVLDRRGIDPALATGPFITTSNDIFGMFIYLLIAKLILGF
ncbi:MAG: magnesium transporter [Flavobacteriales bacterium]|nr:MAG: magnesium transporter [Flavobacteriales bacterium]